MEPQTFEIAVDGAGMAGAGRGILAVYVPGTHGFPSVVVLACDPGHEQDATITELAPAAMAYVRSQVSERALAWHWAVIDATGQFAEAVPEWSKRGKPVVRFGRFAGGTGIDAFFSATGAAGEAAMELLSTMAFSPSMSDQTPTEREFLENVEIHGKLPAPGNVFRRIDEALATGDADLIAAAIQPDPVLALSLIHSANMGRFAAAGKTASVREAVSRLGADVVPRFLFAAKMMGRYKGATCPTFSYRRFWLNSVATGAAMKALMPIHDIPERFADDVFATGLVAGIGWMAIAETFPVLMANYVTRCAGADPIAKARAQREIFPCAIHKVSERYLERYSLPPKVLRAIVGRTKEDRNWFDCLSQAERVAQALAPFECIALPTTLAVPDACRDEWERWKRTLGVKQ